MLLQALALSLLGDIAPPPPPVTSRRPPPPPVACRADGDCRLSTFAGCCPGCCPPPPHAVPVGTREGERCAMVDCAMPDCSAVRCAGHTVGDWVAACVSGRCVAQPRGSECRVDADCRVVTAPAPGCAGPCCCPVSQAVPADAVVPLQRRPPDRPEPDAPKEGAPKFGLSTGGAASPPAPQCAPCPAPQPARAACQVGRCVLRPIERPRPRPPFPG